MGLDCAVVEDVGQKHQARERRQPTSSSKYSSKGKGVGPALRQGNVLRGV